MEDDDISRLADHFGVKEEKSQRCRFALPKGISLSLSVPQGRLLGHLREMLPDPSDNQEQVLGELGFESLARENLREALEILSERQKKVISERYFTEPPRKLHEIAGDLGVSQERVRQIQAESVEKLRGYMAEKLEIHP